MIATRGAAAAGILVVSLAACACSGDGAGVPVTLLDYTARAPSSWQSRPAGNTMRIAEFTIPGPGAQPAEVIIYHFGAGQGGSVEANIERWSSQFSTPDGGPVTPTIADLEGTQFTTTLVELEGSYGRGVGMGPGRDEAVPDQALYAAVVETPLGNLFAQLFGPRAEVRAARAGFVGFLESIKE